MNYAAASAAGNSAVGLVIRLYETVVGDLARAVTAIRDNDIERRTNELEHALAVIGQLQSCLDMERGGEPAKALDRFYELTRARIIDAQVRHSGKTLEDVIQHFLLLRDAWSEIERKVTASQPDTAKRSTSIGSAWLA